MPTPDLIRDVPCRRFGDPVSGVNLDIHDSIGLLQAAIRLLDHHEMVILWAEAVAAPRNNRVQIVWSPAVDKLFPEAVPVNRGLDYTVFVTSRFGVEVRWSRNGRHAA